MEATVEITLEGVLERRNSLGFRSRRFCKLISNQFFVFRNEACSDIEDVLELSSDCVVEIIDATHFRVIQPYREPVALQCDSPDTMLRWVLEIRGAAFTNPKMSMSMFTIVSVIGRGCYGKILLCRHNGTGERYAIKTISKERLITQKRIKFAIAERNNLLRIHHPFVVGLKFAFQSPTKFYLGLEYAPGGDLFRHLSQCLALPIDEVRFYIGEICLAVDHCHRCGVVYRDLKPENVLFDADGHVKLADFGLSREIIGDAALHTICGTPEYLAPEMVLKRPYSFPIDWWAVGVMTYELAFGELPFGSNQNELKMFRRIVEGRPAFPQRTPQDLVDFVLMLLEKDPANRGTFETVQQSAFFANVNWDDILQKRLSPPYVPVIEEMDGVNNFDGCYTDETATDSPMHGSVDLADIPGFSFVEN
jgi:serine/threonine protein kinase